MFLTKIFFYLESAERRMHFPNCLKCFCCFTKMLQEEDSAPVYICNVPCIILIFQCNAMYLLFVFFFTFMCSQIFTCLCPFLIFKHFMMDGVLFHQNDAISCAVSNMQLCMHKCYIISQWAACTHHIYATELGLWLTLLLTQWACNYCIFVF